MRTAVLAIAAVMALSACAVTTERYYLPTDAQYAETGRVCGFVPWGRSHVPLGDSLSSSIELIPVKDGLAVRMQLALPEGVKVRLSSPELRLEAPSTGQEYVARLDRFRVSVFGREGRLGHYEYFEPDSVLEGRGRNAELANPDTLYARKDLFISNAVFVAPVRDSYVLKVPTIEVNGIVRKAQPIPMKLVQQTGVMACVQ